MWSNYHTHSHYCDGKGLLTDYVQAGKDVGLISLGFSSHAPIPALSCKWSMRKESLDDYLQQIEVLKTSHAGFEIYKGLEIDFIPGIISPDDYTHLLDYTIGSIHFIDAYNGSPWEIDGSYEVFKNGLVTQFKNNVQAAISRYYELTREMVRQSPPDIVGHLDKIKIQNKLDSEYSESETWYQDQIDQTLQVIKEANIIVEVNTRGLYQKKSAFTYPSPWILERILSLDIPITLNSDAHHKDDLTNEFQSTASLLMDIGFKNLSILKDGVWKPMPFNKHGIIF